MQSLLLGSLWRHFLARRKVIHLKKRKSEVAVLAWLMRLVITDYRRYDKTVIWWCAEHELLKSAAWHFWTGSLICTPGGNHEDSKTLQTVIRRCLNVCWCKMIANDTSYVWSILRRLAVNNGSVRRNSRDFGQRGKLHHSILSALIWKRGCIANMFLFRLKRWFLNRLHVFLHRNLRLLRNFACSKHTLCMPIRNIFKL